MDSFYLHFPILRLTPILLLALAAPLTTVATDATERSAHVDANGALDRNSSRLKGRKALADGIPDAAARFFRDYLIAAGNVEPQRTDATLLLVQALLRQGDAVAAANVFTAYDRATQEMPPGQPRADVSWLDKVEYWRALTGMEQAQWVVARAQLSQLIARETDKELLALALEAQGDCCVRQGDWAAATQLYARHQEEFPHSPRGNAIARNLVLCRIGAGDLPGATAALAKLGERAKDTPAVLELPTISILLASHDLAGAWTRYQAAVAKPEVRADRSFWLVSRQLADLLIRENRLADAQDVLTKSLPASPTLPDRRQTWLLVIDLMLRQGQTEPAVAELERFLSDRSTAPDRAPALLRLARTVREAGKPLVAADRYGEVASMTDLPQTTRFPAALLQADCQLDAKMYAAAANLFANAVGLASSPEQKGEALFRAAEAANAAGNPGQAADWYADARAAAPGGSTAAKALFNEALSRSKQGRAAEAAELFTLFLKENPEHPLLPQALLELGIALRAAAQFEQAVAIFDSLVATRPKNELAPQALLESHATSLAAGSVPAAIATLERLRQLYPEASQALQALYFQAHLQFLANQPAAAIETGNRFLEQYPTSPLGADILIWIGDYEASQNRPTEAEKRYLDVALRFPASPLAPQALIDTARSAFLRRDLERTARMVALLDEKYSASLPPHQLAQTRFVYGELLADQGAYENALLSFQKAAAAAPGTEYAFQAIGRQGDMQAALGDDNAAEHLVAATELYQKLLESPDCPPALADMISYRLGKVLERRKLSDQALKQYLELFYQFDVDRDRGTIRDWTWFVRAGNDAARLLILSENPNSADSAARVYERLAASGAPGTGDAAAKAKELRVSHHLDR